MFATVGDALDAQLMTLPGFDAANCAWENTGYTPQPGTPYLTPQLVAITRSAIAAGVKGAIRWDGTYQVSVYRAQGEGTDPARTMVDALLKLFPRGLTLTTTDGLNVIFEVPKPMPLVPELAWIKGVARMPFFFFEMPS